MRIVRIYPDIVSIVWGNDRPAPRDFNIKVHPLKFAGEKWLNKIHALRELLIAARCDAMVVTSLTEIAYILNLRGNDIPYLPVFKSYLIVTQREIYLYMDRKKENMSIKLHLKSVDCYNENCVRYFFRYFYAKVIFRLKFLHLQGEGLRSLFQRSQNLPTKVAKSSVAGFHIF